MGVGLGAQGVGLGLEGLHGVGAGSEAGRRLVEPGKLHERVGELPGVAALLAIMLRQAATVSMVRSA